MSEATEPQNDDLDSGPLSPVRHNHGRRESDNFMRAIQKYWAILSFILTMGIGLLIYIHSSDMSRVVNLEANDAILAQQRATNLQRLAVVEERTLRMEKAMSAQDDKLDQILKAVQWQQEATRKQQKADRQ